MKLNQLVNYVFEGRDAPLYHATDMEWALQIIEENVLRGKSVHSINGKRYKGVSLTRDFNFAKYFGDEQNGKEMAIIFQLDQSKLTQRYKIIPVDYFSLGRKFSKDDDMYFDMLRRKGIQAEAEEFVIGDINNINQYIDAIIIGKEAFKSLKSMVDDNINIGLDHLNVAAFLANPKLKIQK